MKRTIKDIYKFKQELSLFTIDDVIHQYYRKTKGHFFDADAMKFFKSKVYNVFQVNEKYIYFLTSERFVNYFPSYHSEPRKYTVRVMDKNTFEILDNDFQKYSSKAAAEKAMIREALK